MQRRLHAFQTACCARDSWIRLRRDPESKSGILPVRLRNNHVAIFDKVANAPPGRAGVATMFAARRSRAIRAGASCKHGQCPAARSQYLNLPDCEEMLEFQRESGARHCLEPRHSRFRRARVGGRFINR
jgi:hypothetical protein